MRKSKVNTITLYDGNEWNEKIASSDFRISQLMVQSIFENLDNKKPVVEILKIKFTIDGSELTIALKRGDFKNCLEQNLKIWEINEEFEGCAKIKEVIDKL